MLLGGHDQVVAHAHLAKHLQGLKGAPHPQAAQGQRAQTRDVLSVEFNAPLIRADLPEHAVEQGGFARSIGADDTKYFTRLHFKRHPTHGLDGTVGFFQLGHF